MSMFASIADYNAALDADKSAVIAHYAEQERQAAEEAQQAKDAARYQWLRKFWLGDDAWLPDDIVNVYDGAQMDAAIDAQIAKEQ